MRKKGNLFIVSGPSGVGKSTILKRILRNNKNIIFSISCTTRQKRIDEIDGKDYFFISKENFLNKIKNEEFIEWAKVHENYYGTLKKWIEDNLKTGKDIILDIDYQGAKNIKKSLTNGTFVFIIPPTLEILKERIMERNTENDESLKKRLENAKRELKKKDFYDYIIKNDVLEEAAMEFKNIIELKRKNL
ncbi:MAG: guanylate kinase [Elusimicrobiota bacterium]|jgi:guanylate kinase|nr:guanylate kinase [Elusimicrobiota bacterium]